MSADGSDKPRLANKRELARVLGISGQGLDLTIARFDDFPVERRGRSGQEWAFNVAAVIAFLREKKRADEQEQAARAEFFDQFTLGLEEPGDALALTPAQRLAAVRARAIEMKLAQEARTLVPATEMRQTLAMVIKHLGNGLDGLPRNVAQTFNLPDAVTRGIKAEIDGLRGRLVSELRAILEENPRP